MAQDRYLVVKSSGGNVAGTHAGLGKLFELLGAHRTGMIVVPQIGKVNRSLLTDVLGPEVSKQLLWDRQITLPDGKTIGILLSRN